MRIEISTARGEYLNIELPEDQSVSEMDWTHEHGRVRLVITNQPKEGESGQ